MRPRTKLTRLLLGVGLAALVWTGALGQTAVPRLAYDTPLACIEALHSGLIELSSNEDRGGLTQRYERLLPLIRATHDLRYIAEFTTRRHWDGFDDEARESFVRQFERLSVMNYAARFVALSEDTFALDESRLLASGRAQVIASIGRDAQSEISLEYLLHEDVTGWRIIDIVAEGVSDLALKRAEYQRVLADGTLLDLLEVLDEQITAL